MKLPLMLCLYALPATLAINKVICYNAFGELKCKNGQTLDIVQGDYGRTTHCACPAPNGNAAFTKNINCVSPQSLCILACNCKGQQTCRFKVNSLMFGDPCFGTYKYLNVTYTCKQEKAIACEHRALQLKCPPNSVLSVTSANYGRTEPYSAVCKPEDNGYSVHGKVPNLNCRSCHALRIVKNKCDGKSSCQVNSKNAVFNDPCVGTYKYLQVSYICT